VGRIVVRKSTQIGWSEILNNVTGYFIDADPKPIMMVQPTDFGATAYSKKRIKPLIDNCPALRAKIRVATSRQAGNTIQLKEFDGGFFKITGANAGAGLRSDPVPILLLDEVEAYPLDVDGEGSPIKIAEKRTGTFDDAKILIGSTPALPKGLSVIDDEFENSSQGYYHVPCPFCGFAQPLIWRDPETGLYRLHYEKDAHNRIIPQSVYYQCADCGAHIDEKFKQRMLDHGRWVHKFPDRKDGRGCLVRGFHINALYSPWRPVWGDLAQEWVDAQDNPEKLKTFINLSLGESFNEGGETLEAHELAARKETYAAAVPMNCCVLVATVDVQHNRLEVQVTGFGVGEESWLIEHEIIFGDPGTAEVWRELDEFLIQPYQHESGAQLLPSITLIDSGDGGHADSVYDYVMPRQHTRRRVFACKGVDYLSKPGLADEGKTKRGNIRLFTVATYAAKDRIFARLKLSPPKPGEIKPGYVHFPHWATDEYFEQLTAEKKIPIKNRVTRAMRYVYVRQHPRNEALDLTVYAHAGLFVLQRFIDPVTFHDLARLAARVKQGQTGALASRTRRVRSRGID
jgi:phage terminase large subunit GpA-like protein